MFGRQVTQRVLGLFSVRPPAGRQPSAGRGRRPDPLATVIRVPDTAAGVDWWCTRFHASVVASAVTGDLTSVLLSFGPSCTAVLIGGPGAMEYYAPAELRASLSDPQRSLDPWGNPLSIADGLSI